VDEPAPRGLQRIRRRDALRLLAASTGAVAGGSLIVSSPAHADVGSEGCLFAFTGNPVVTVNAFNWFFDYFALSMGPPPGSCGCDGVASIEYAFHLSAPLNTATSGPWSPSNSFSLLGNFWPNGGGSFTVSAGVRITCTGPSGTTVRCRFASATFNMPASVGSVGETFPLPDNNGNGTFPNLPVCNAEALRFAALSTDRLTMMPGIAPIPPDLRAAIDGAPTQPPIDVLGEQPQLAVEQPTPDTSASETTTTPPAQVPETTPSTTTTTSTTIPVPTTASTTDATTTSTPPAD
jgi:hypothetical protein